MLYPLFLLHRLHRKVRKKLSSYDMIFSLFFTFSPSENQKIFEVTMEKILNLYFVGLRKKYWILIIIITFIFLLKRACDLYYDGIE